MCEHHLFIIIVPNDFSHPENSVANTHDSEDGETPQFDRVMPAAVESVSLHPSSLCQLLQNAILDKYDLNDYTTWILSADRKQYEVSFTSEIGTLCEELLHRLAEIGIGRLPGTRVAVLPLTYAISYTPSPYKTSKVPRLSSTSIKPAIDYAPKFTSTSAKIASDHLPDIRQSRRKSIRADFMQSIRSRLMVFQVVQAIRTQSLITFDFVLLLTIASVLASLGLLENSSVILVASMLISPLMGPILAIVFGLCIHDRSLWKAGLRSELLGLFICVFCGFLIGLGTSVWETNWGSTTSFPTPEMKARGDLTRLSVGAMIALPSGAGVALSVLGGNAGSLVGVAISASLLPPAVNSGILMGYSLLTIAFPNSFGRHSNDTYIFQHKIYPYKHMTCPTFLANDYRSLYSCKMPMEAFILAIASFLTLVNIICIVVCALIVLLIKEVAPSGGKDEQQVSDTDRFFHDDMRRFRDYQKTIHNSEELVEEEKAVPTVAFHTSDSAKRERRKQLLALASLHDLDLRNQNDLTLNNAQARDKVKKLYKTMVQFDEDAKRLNIGLKNKQPLPTMMMDVLPPKWTELFQHQREQEIVDDDQGQNESIHSHPSCLCQFPAHYKTYHDAFTIHSFHDRHYLGPSPRKSRTHSYSAYPVRVEPVSVQEEEQAETQLRGTRFRLSKATIPLNDEDEHYV